MAANSHTLNSSSSSSTTTTTTTTSNNSNNGNTSNNSNNSNNDDNNKHKHSGVCDKKALLRRRKHMGIFSFRAPTRGGIGVSAAGLQGKGLN